MVVWPAALPLPPKEKALTDTSHPIPTQQVDFAGVGLMGHGMAKNIVEKGYPLTIIGRCL
jgi:phosphoserine aminotransferase